MGPNVVGTAASVRSVPWRVNSPLGARCEDDDGIGESLDTEITKRPESSGRRGNADTGDRCSMGGPRNRKGVTIDLTDRQAKNYRMALTFGFGLLSTAILIAVVSNVAASAGVNEPRREIVKNTATGQNTEQTDVTLSQESLFDKLFRKQKDGAVAYDIPFPFTALTRRIAANLAVPEGKAPSLLQVLIPLGRSLQRYAAEPEYFRYPRVIVAVDAEPAASPGHAGILLRDRLYLAYQERSNTIEVISYNEEAGRFEFQVVDDYAPGLTPTVSYANRMLCMGCHQNGGPIWSEPPWEETNSNPRIVGLLQEQN